MSEKTSYREALQKNLPIANTPATSTEQSLLADNERLGLRLSNLLKDYQSLLQKNGKLESDLEKARDELSQERFQYKLCTLGIPNKASTELWATLKINSMENDQNLLCVKNLEG